MRALAPFLALFTRNEYDVFVLFFLYFFMIVIYKSGEENKTLSAVVVAYILMESTMQPEKCYGNR